MSRSNVQQPGVGRGHGMGQGSKRPDAKLRRFDAIGVDMDKLDVQLGYPPPPKPGSRLKKVPADPKKKAP